MKAILYLEDGTVYTGRAFGSRGTTLGELVFNTSITGYQEILTDPSYAGQIINMTYPLIGNYGINSFENESNRIYARGLIIRELSLNPSNYKSEVDIDEMLTRMGIVGICGVDTRSITRKIRNSGVMKCVITTEDLTVAELEKLVCDWEFPKDMVKEVSTDRVVNIPGKGFKVAVLDFGIKNNIIENLKMRGCDITIFPYNAAFGQVMKMKPDGLFLSNGPGDPKMLGETILNVKKLIEVLPTFGICLGHQIIALSLGAETCKMKYGHRGGNHGVYDIQRDRAFITSQNHGYAVMEDSIKSKGLEVTHINLNDHSIEGMQHKILPIFSVQFHPEGAPGPQDTAYLFDKFITLMEKTSVRII